MKPIDLMIVGVQKAATTSLLRYLGEHPEIEAQTHLEFSYFNKDDEYTLGYEKSLSKHFPNATSGKMIVAKNATLSDTPVAIERLHEHNPDCKIVMLVRNPVERAYSSYLMARNRGWMDREFDELIEILDRGDESDVMYRLFVRLGIYTNHVKNILHHFPESAFKIFVYEDFVKEPDKVTKEVFDFLGVDSEFVPNIAKRHNETKVQRSNLYGSFIEWARSNDNKFKKIVKRLIPYSIFTKLGQTAVRLNKSEKRFESMSENARATLSEFYSSHNKELEQMTDLDLGRWS